VLAKVREALERRHAIEVSLVERRKRPKLPGK
jgi:hypothetical protein